MSDPESRPPGRGPSVACGLWVAVVGAVVLWSLRGAGVDPGALLSPAGLGQMAAYARRLFPPDLSAATLVEAGHGAVETLAISLAGTALAAGLAVPLAIAATWTLVSSRRGHLRGGLDGRRASRILVYAGAKAVLNLLRTVPEIVWALVFVFAVGLGPFPGVLALGVHTGGVLGKLFGEVLEDVSQGPVEALEAGGASRAAVLLYGMLPQVWPQWTAYALYRWEVNVRAAAVLGFVGAGGLGQRVHIAISLFLENQLLTLLLAIYLMVTLVDALSGWARRRLV